MDRHELILAPDVAPLVVLRAGAPGARPKAVLQAGLHADEFPGMLALCRLAPLLAEAEARGRVRGEILLLPQANPIGLGQRQGGMLQGRVEAASGANFNRDYADLAPPAAVLLQGRLGPDPGQNVAIIRGALAAALAATAPQGAVGTLRHTLLGLACDADLVLDLHADNQALCHLYVGPPLWPAALDIAAEIDARAVLLAEESGGHPFDEACAGPWWTLARRFPGHPVPPACLAATVELGSNDEVDEDLGARQAAALYRVLERRGMIERTGEGGLGRLLCEATPLSAMQQLRAPGPGLVLYRAPLGARVEAGDVVAEIIDPLGGPALPVQARTAGLLFARHSQPYAWTGRVIGKIAGAMPLPERTGALLTD